MNEAIDFYKKHGIEECKRAYALSVNAGCEDLEMKRLIEIKLNLNTYKETWWLGEIK